MKYLASLFGLIALLTVPLFPQTVLADSTTTVNLSNNGANSQNNVTVNNNTGGINCDNGNCTTSQSTDQVTSCINGQCQTSDNGNLHMQSSDGNDQVNVSNTMPTNSVTAVPSPTPTSAVSVSPEPSNGLSPVPTVNPSPTTGQIHRHIRKQIKEQINQLKEHMKDQNAALSSLIQSFQNMLSGLFK